MTSKDYFRNPLYAASAAPENIADKLHREQQAAKRVARRIAWLEDLLKLRTAEKAAGTWPTSTPPDDQPKNLTACSGCGVSDAACRSEGGHCCDACQHHEPPAAKPSTEKFGPALPRVINRRGRGG